MAKCAISKFCKKRFSILYSARCDGPKTKLKDCYSSSKNHRGLISFVVLFLEVFLGANIVDLGFAHSVNRFKSFCRVPLTPLWRCQGNARLHSRQNFKTWQPSSCREKLLKTCSIPSTQFSSTVMVCYSKNLEVVLAKQ